MAEQSLTGKAILVCGATSGIGEATGRRLARSGARSPSSGAGRCSARSSPATSAELEVNLTNAFLSLKYDDPCSVRRPAQRRRAVTIQARESNQIPSPLACAASVSRSRSSARSAATGSSRFSTSLVQVKLRTQSSAAATSGP
jgi:NAD(P)-dependent dehydrogenase (short-subunit alcohol dehydrogenase family)